MPPAARRAVVLVDGEHHPPVVRAALAALAAEGTQVVEAVIAGGGEKLAEPGRAPDLGVPTSVPASAERALVALVGEHQPDVVIDLSGAPVIGPRRRLELAAIALGLGVAYEAPGLRTTPPPTPTRSPRPTVAVIGTAKRTGKTAICGALTRHASSRGRTPVVVAMGRGGPPEPVVVPAGTALGAEALLAVAAEGRHAASDFYEDAVTTGATTVGCFRVGDGPAGEVGHSNVPAGVAVADEAPGDLLLLEGSGAAIPPVHADATALVVPATASPADLAATLPVAMLRSDLVLVGFAEQPSAGPSQVTAVVATVADLTERLPRLTPDGAPPPIALTGLRPTPLEEIDGARVYFATTAPPTAGDRLRVELERRGAQVVGTSHALADRPRLRADLDAAPPHDVLLTEVKAAGIDVAARHAHDRGVRVVLCDHRPVIVDPPAGMDRGRLADDLDAAFDRLIALADRRCVTDRG